MLDAMLELMDATTFHVNFSAMCLYVFGISHRNLLLEYIFPALALLEYLFITFCPFCVVDTASFLVSHPHMPKTGIFSARSICLCVFQ